MQKKIQTAIFGGGCFWCTEAVFKMLKGVISVTTGYAGGSMAKPSYEHVSSGTTGHAQVVRVDFDPEKISYTDLLTVFFATHDPTTANRQGADVGPQYRSLILYTDDAQKKEAERFIHDINASHPKGKPVVTEVVPFEKFYEAEHYRHDYYEKNADQPYCQVVIEPKLEKVQKMFGELLKNAS